VAAVITHDSTQCVFSPSVAKSPPPLAFRHSLTRLHTFCYIEQSGGEEVKYENVMALADYKFCGKGEVEAVSNGDSFSVLVDGKIACSMATGGCHRFPTALQAELFGRQLVRGNTGGTFLSADITNYIA